MYIALTRAIDNGANAIAEGFLFSVAALLILGETWRSSRSQAKRREGVDDRLDELTSTVEALSKKVDDLSQDFDEKWSDEKQRYATRASSRDVQLICHASNDELTRILERVVEIGLRGGWAEFEDSPLAIPRIQLVPSKANESPPLPQPPSDDTPTDIAGSQK